MDTTPQITSLDNEIALENQIQAPQCGCPACSGNSNNYGGLHFESDEIDITKGTSLSSLPTSVSAGITALNYGSSQPSSINYTMNSVTGFYGNGYGTDWRVLTSTQQEAVTSVLQEYANVANVTFNNTASTTPTGNNIVYRTTDITESGVAGRAYYPGPSDVMLDHAYMTNVAKGSFGYFLILHETGHAMGLSHPGGVGNNSAYNVDSTVMSYNSGASVSAGTGGLHTETLQIYDIATLQYKYGANHNYNAGNDTYVLTGASKAFTLWDGAGQDTISSTGFAGNAIIDLREGASNLTSVGSTKMWIAFGANIEHAQAGGGNDSLYGNDFNNQLGGGGGSDRLVGSEGHDTLTGGTGDDTLEGGNGNDNYYVDSAGDVVIEAASAGTDTVFSDVSHALGDYVENLTLLGSSTSFATGNGLANVIVGNNGNNIITGGAGIDSLTGGAGGDLFAFTSVSHSGVGAGNRDILTDFKQAESDKIDLNSFSALRFAGSNSFSATSGEVRFGQVSGNTVIGVDIDGNGMADFDIQLIGAINLLISDFLGLTESTVTPPPPPPPPTPDRSGNDTISGTAGNDLIDGEGGNDNINGIEGNDTLIGSAGDDTLDGGTGADLLTGGEGNDLYYVDNAADSVVEAAGSGIDTVISDITVTLSNHVEYLTLNGMAAIDGTGNALDNILTGNSGNNSLTGGEGNDTVIGGAGDDRIVGDIITTTTSTPSTNLVVNGSFEADNIGSGWTMLSTITGWQRSIGTATEIHNGDIAGITASSGNQKIELDSNQNTNLVQAIATNGTGALTLSFDYSPRLGVSEASNIIEVYWNGALIDSLTGTIAGWTTHSYQLNGAGATTNLEFRAAGLSDGVGGFLDNVSVTSSSTTTTSLVSGNGNDLLNGEGGNDSLNGGAGDDTLNGGSGTDLLEGGAGNDLYYVDNTADSVVEDLNSGTDTVISDISITLASNVENLTLNGTSSINATGNLLNNVILGNNGNNIIIGGGGADSLTGGAGGDSFVLSALSHSGIGAGNRDVITDFNRASNDKIDLSSFGALRFIGGANFTATAGEVRFEQISGTTIISVDSNGNGATDFEIQLSTAISLLISDFIGLIEPPVLPVGTSGNDTITGTLGNDSINGEGGNDSITGLAGNDTLNGGAGDDTLSGGTGADLLTGGTGNDVYFIDNLDDVIVEGTTAGTDTVVSDITLTLGNNVEHLTLNGTAVINGTGNGLANLIIGNSAANSLSGGNGNDSLSGGDGNDTFSGGQGNDLINGGAGADSILANTGDDIAYGDEGNDTVEGNDGNDALYGGNGDDSLNGAKHDDLLYGDSGNDFLTGGSGVDQLFGGDGNDVLQGNSDADTLTGGLGVDQLTGGSQGDVFRFTSLGDSIDSLRDTITDFARGQDRIQLTGLGFTGVTAGAGFGSQLGMSISGNNTLLVDADSDFSILLSGKLTLTNADFIF